MSWTLRLEDDPAGLCAQCRGQERAGVEAKTSGGMPGVPLLLAMQRGKFQKSVFN